MNSSTNEIAISFKWIMKDNMAMNFETTNVSFNLNLENWYPRE